MKTKSALTPSAGFRRRPPNTNPPKKQREQSSYEKRSPSASKRAPLFEFFSPFLPALLLAACCLELHFKIQTGGRLRNGTRVPGWKPQKRVAFTLLHHHASPCPPLSPPSTLSSSLSSEGAPESPPQPRRRR